MASMLQDRHSSRLGTPMRSPARHPTPWFDVDHPSTLRIPRRSSLDYAATGCRSPAVMRGARDLTGFSTPQRVTVMGREHDWVEFRTPQHPASGTNNWGGASPLLSRNIPKKSLETNYLKFNPSDDDAGCGLTDLAAVLGSPMQSEGEKKGGDAKRRKRDWVFGKLGWKYKKEEKVLGFVENKRKKKGTWFLGAKLSRRWPQGW